MEIPSISKNFAALGYWSSLETLNPSVILVGIAISKVKKI